MSHQELAKKERSSIAHTPSIKTILEHWPQWKVARRGRWGNLESSNLLRWCAEVNDSRDWWWMSPFISTKSKIASPNVQLVRQTPPSHPGKLDKDWWSGGENQNSIYVGQIHYKVRRRNSSRASTQIEYVIFPQMPNMMHVMHHVFVSILCYWGKAWVLWFESLGLTLFTSY